MEIEIRSASLKDECAIKELIKSIPGNWQETWRDSAVSISLKSAGDLALVACYGKNLIGFASFHDVGFRAYISEMVIHKDYQKSGIGTLILKRAEDILRRKGCQLMVADVYPPAQMFYLKNGWGEPRSKLLSKMIESKRPG